MNKETFNKIIDQVYIDYQNLHQDEPFILSEEMGLSKDEFINKATNNRCFGLLFGLDLTEKKLTFEEKINWVMRNTDVDLENLAITERAMHPDTPIKLITLKYQNKTVEIYE
jgi:hypothetical protein